MISKEKRKRIGDKKAIEEKRNERGNEKKRRRRGGEIRTEQRRRDERGPLSIYLSIYISISDLHFSPLFFSYIQCHSLFLFLIISTISRFVYWKVIDIYSVKQVAVSAWLPS